MYEVEVGADIFSLANEGVGDFELVPCPLPLVPHRPWSRIREIPVEALSDQKALHSL
jgi:hypothetical protein